MHPFASISFSSQGGWHSGVGDGCHTGHSDEDGDGLGVTELLLDTDGDGLELDETLPDTDGDVEIEGDGDRRSQLGFVLFR